LAALRLLLLDADAKVEAVGLLHHNLTFDVVALSTAGGAVRALPSSLSSLPHGAHQLAPTPLRRLNETLEVALREIIV
jgi:hypothetical protein